AFEKAQEPLRSKLKTYRLITVIFTNQPFSGSFTDIPLNCLLICKQNFQDYFGHVFAYRAAFAMTRDNNPNVLNPDRLCTTLKLPKLLSSEISRKRPFRTVKMMIFFPYGNDVRDLDSSKKLRIDPECQRMSNVKLNNTDKENFVVSMIQLNIKR
ncbi:11876_t:CDS:2, partial [Racocetra persica]